MGPGTDTAIPRREPALFRKNSLDEMTVGRTEKPLAKGPLPKKPVQAPTDTADPGAPIRREKIGIGSYEDPAETKRKGGRRTGKTGRPGR